MASGKTVLITGANSGIGLASSKILASKGWNVLVLCRKAAAGEALAAELQQKFPGIKSKAYCADLSDFKSIQIATAAILADFPVIDVLLNNAGYYAEKVEYVDGIEKTTYASHLGHFLLTHGLMPALERAPEARIVNVSSAAHMMGRIERAFDPQSGASSLNAYADAKLANILFTMGLTKRLPPHITAYALHPGVVNTRFASETTGLMGILVRAFGGLLTSPEKGAATSVYLVTADIARIKPDAGKYFANSKVKSSRARDLTADKAEWLWEKTVAALKGWL